MRSVPVPAQGIAPDFPSQEIIRALELVSNLFLIDTWLGQEPVEGYVGITGQPVDWEMAKRVVAKSRIPVILAGGLSPENVYDALIKVQPAGADSCTQTNLKEHSDQPIRFKKDFKRVAQFIAEVRRAEEDKGEG
jgi:phosphoribosylanthranilate isomerase